MRDRQREVLQVVDAGAADEDRFLRDAFIIPMASFTARLISWYEAAQRDLPWRRTRDPWRILVSEIMLQQTRAATVIPYWFKFLERYPTPQAFADAAESDILHIWAGLGYYSRARNLQKAAQAIVANGQFPSDYASIRALPGVGDYTAAAVASFCFNLPYAVLDGNVLRVMARLTNDASDIATPSTKIRLQAAVDERLDRKRPAAFNQAIMELGATLCLPRNPQCLLCPVQPDCQALKAGRVNELPVKLKKGESIKEERTLLIVQRGDDILLWQRPDHERRLAGFYELPEPHHLNDPDIGDHLGDVRHGIVNHDYTFHVYAAKLRSRIRVSEGQSWNAWDSLADLPLSTVARKALSLLGRPLRKN